MGRKLASAAERPYGLTFAPLRHPPIMDTVLEFFHSLLRWAALLALVTAIVVAWRGYFAKSPIIVWHRGAAIIAMVLCHVQLVIGGLLYGLRYSTFAERFSANPTLMRFWKMEHIGTMVLAVALITAGRILSKKAKTEEGKQLRVAIFYTIGLLLILAMIPWPFMAKFAHAYGWL